jgi:hypothetical protein
MQILLVVTAAASVALQCGQVDYAAARAEAQHEWVSCITGAVQRLDDGRSDAAAIAGGVAPMCAASYQALVTSMYCVASTPRAQISLRDNYEELERKLATSAVLAFRATTRRGAPAPRE